MKIFTLAMGLVLSIAFVPNRSHSKVISNFPSKLEHKLRRPDGGYATLEKIKEKQVAKKGMLIIFGCNHCPFVKGWIDRIVQIGNEAISKDIGVVMINSNDPKAYPTDGFTHTRVLHKEKKMKFPYVIDGSSDVARYFGASRTPEIFLFNPAGRLVYHGAVDDNFEDASKVKSHYLKDAISQLLEGKSVSPSRTKFIGCSIKLREKQYSGTKGDSKSLSKPQNQQSKGK